MNHSIKPSPFLLLVLLLFAYAQASHSQQTTAFRGQVICDGKGIQNVVVTDGYHCEITDSSGHYTLPFSDYDTKFISISTPAGYLPPDSLNVPAFYQRVNENQTEYNFELKKNPKDDHRHVLLVHADPQFFKVENFNQYEKTIEDCQSTINQYEDIDVFGIDCGDLTGDKPQLYSQYIQSLNKTGIPFYRVLGNHDMNYGGRSHEKSVQKFNDIFGPTYYSFNRGKVHYIVLNNVFYLGRDYFYMGYLTEKMLHWLEQDLNQIPQGSTVFVAMHIPARLTDKPQPFKYDNETISQQTVNASALFKMLEPYNAHILTGHMHTNDNIIHAPNLYEHNTGAICGAWWQGGYCLDGTPLGYGVYEITGSDVEWYFKSVGHPRSHQMRVYPPGSNNEYPDDMIVNIWNWDKNWKVEWFENGVSKGEMTRFEAIDPEVVKMCADKEKLDFEWISPSKTNHMFRTTLLNPDADIKVKVTDSFGNVYENEI